MSRIGLFTILWPQGIILDEFFGLFYIVLHSPRSSCHFVVLLYFCLLWLFSLFWFSVFNFWWARQPVLNFYFLSFKVLKFYSDEKCCVKEDWMILSEVRMGLPMSQASRAVMLGLVTSVLFAEMQFFASFLILARANVTVFNKSQNRKY